VAAGYSKTAGAGDNNYDLQAVLNLPLMKDELAFRLVHYRYLDSGFYKNRAGSNAAFQAALAPYRVDPSYFVDADGMGEYYVRGTRIAGLWRPIAPLRLTLGYLTQRNETDGIPISMNAPFEQTVPRVAPGHDHRGQQFGVLDTKIEISSATLEYDLNWADLVATYSRVKGGNFYVRPYPTIGFNLPVSQINDTPHDGKVGELRLSTKLDGRWSAQGGFFWEDAEDRYTIDTQWFGDPATNAPVRSVLGTTLDTRTLDHKAAFGEVNWEFYPRWTVTAGARAFKYEKTSRRDFSYIYTPPQPPAIGSVEDNGTTYRANLSFKPTDDALIYGLFSQGFRVGGAQADCPIAATPMAMDWWTARTCRCSRPARSIRTRWTILSWERSSWHWDAALS
jgi:outer membrane receptor protein involved in Fe transport